MCTQNNEDGAPFILELSMGSVYILKRWVCVNGILNRFPVSATKTTEEFVKW